LSKELPFTSQLWEKLRDYLSKYSVAGKRLEVKPLGAVSYDGKIPDIVITDEKGIPVLIIETKRKGEGKPAEDIINPFRHTPIAQALCYAALALENLGLSKTPLFATANKDVMYVFNSIERDQLQKFVDINACRERHVSPDDWGKVLKPGAYSTLITGYLLTVLEKPLSDDSIKKLFDILAERIREAPLSPISPAQLYRVLIDQLRHEIEGLHDEYVEDAVKTKIFRDLQYFKELHELAQKQGYANGLLSSGILSLCLDEERSSKERVCKPLAGKISEILSKAKDAQQLYSLLIDIAEKHVNELVEYCKEEVKQSGVSPATCNKKVRDVISFRNLSRMMTYVLATKILACKVLEVHYRDIPSLTPLDAEKFRSSDDIVKALNSYFENIPKVIEERLEIRDFTPIFRTGLYDRIVFKGVDAISRINALIEIADAIKDAIKHFPGIIGYVYEGFIPPHERHQLGQFYTPPAIARLIARWAIRSPNDRVLDGGCGSGTFLIEAYKRLLLLKFNKEYGKDYPACKEGVNEHQEILNSLYGVDINAFAAQLTSLHLMLMEPRCPFSRLNIEVRDFFSISQKDFDAVIGNPPYTRWTEIPEATKELIRKSVGNLMKDYDLVAAIGRGREIEIYVY